MISKQLWGAASRRMALASLATVTLAGTLSACAPLLVGGAMVGGTLVAIDRRTSGAQLDDEAIEIKGALRLREVVGATARVSLTSYNRLVLITGEVANDADKRAVEQAVARLDNVRSVVNDLHIGPAISLTARSNDLVTSGKVKASFVDAHDLQANTIKVVTQRGIVYLMGRLTEREAQKAVEVARGVGGVQKVVRVLELISERELEEIRKGPAAK
jgi:osmotically-inducible protein OsmY